MTKQCAHCKKTFPIHPEDLEFYKHINVSAPTLCEPDRRLRRLAWRNEYTLYQGNCDLCHEDMVTMYGPSENGRSFPVYCQGCWWSDRWDGKDYGIDYDSHRPFFEQFAELIQKVPRISLINKESDNSKFGNFTWKNKDCYMLLTSAECVETYYTNRSWRTRNSADCSNVIDCELCYEVIDSTNCYSCSWLQNSNHCHDCWFGYNLQNCSDCFGCTNLSNSQFCIFNEQYSEAEYKQHITILKKDLQTAQTEFEKLKRHTVRRFNDAIACNNSTGDALYHCKNAKNCFRVKNIENCKNVFDATNLKDCMDMNNGDNSELVYESIGMEGNYLVKCTDICWFNSEICYCSLCFNSKLLFGCIGLKKDEHCILNKRYAPEEYKKLMTDIIQNMTVRKEYGEFFPISLSPFGYNETVAMNYFPVDQKFAGQQGWNWRQELPGVIGQVITKEVLVCNQCHRNYRVIAQELGLYSKLNLSVPKCCWQCRHRARLALRNQDVLYTRTCQCTQLNHDHAQVCVRHFETTYSPERKELIYCEQCYNKEIY